MLYFLALAWHTAQRGGTSSRGRPAAALELALLWRACPRLYRRAVPGRHLWRAAQERAKKSSSPPSGLEQQALERWQLQKEAQIEQMMRDGMPLGAVAAALASPETPNASPSWRRPRVEASRPWTRARLECLRAGRIRPRVLSQMVPSAATECGGRDHAGLQALVTPRSG